VALADKKTERLATLLRDVVALRDEVASGISIYRAWRDRIERPAFAASGLNFAHYLAFRRIDLRRLQRRLMVLGLSSLGRCEGHVLTTLDAIAWALARMAGHKSPRGPSDRQFFRGERQLRLNTAELFGPPREGRTGRIMVTLGLEAAEDPGFVADLANRGADVVRINCGHDDADIWRRMIENTRAAARVRPLRVLMDIAGPKVRMKQVISPRDKRHLLVGDQILL
jgi:pyruvate kinase